MATKTKQWADGSSATIQYDGQGDGEIIITSDPNSVYEARSMQITVETTDGSGISRTVTIQQAAKQRIDISAAVVTASNQTYSGSAKKPTPTVTLNGSTVPSSGYDVAYSNNTNAGTATITITGKGDYTGVAYGTFTINKATPSYTAPATRSLTYNGGSQYLTTSGSTSHGTIYYSLDGSNWYTSRRTAATAGSYNCYWKLVGDSNHTDISSTYIGTTTIAKASRTLSFADSYMVLNTSSTGTKTATPSAGNGDGAITYSIANTTYATINSSTGAVTSKTSDGSVIVTASIAEGQNYLGATATYTLYVFATTHNYSYSGNYRSVTLPPGTYQFQCWGAQGGSNATDPSLGITAQEGGKGGYSVGQLTISQATGIRVYVGGKGTTSDDGNVGAFNGGGAVNWGSSTKDEDGEYGKTRFGGGGGATDIRLSDGSLYSRMIVAGGGSGGAMCYKRVTSSQDVYTPQTTGVYQEFLYYGQYITRYHAGSHVAGEKLRVYVNNNSDVSRKIVFYNGSSVLANTTLSNKTYKTFTCPANTTGILFEFISSSSYDDNHGTVNVDLITQEQVVTESNESQVGYAGGGTNGGGYSSTYYGKQNGAGNEGNFGNGATQYAGVQRYVSGAGGGGWYGGGRGFSNTTTDGVKYSGGGSGFVNTAASAGNRPSGYTGLQLDSGTTYAGNTSFPAPGGGNETGHSGNGYVRITRIS